MTGGAAEDEVAFFCLADGPAYVPTVITALRLVQRFHPRAGFHIVGRFGDDTDTMAMIARHGLSYRQLDLSDVFADTIAIRRHPLARKHPRSTWPSECFWWLYAVPHLFVDLGYRYSCALDGDTLAVQPLQLDELFDAPISGVRKRNGEINSGVLFFDNDGARSTCTNEPFTFTPTDRVCHHPQCSGFCRALSDQTLLQRLEQVGGLAVRPIDNAYNHMLFWDEWSILDKNPAAPFGIDETRVVHLLSKPWNPPVRRGRLSPITCEAYDRWWSYAREIWSDDELARSFGRQRTLDAGRSLTRVLRP